MVKEKNTNPILVFTLMLLLFAWVSGYIAFVYRIDLYRYDTENTKVDKHKADAIIVLTGGSNRIKSGFYLLEQKVAQKLFITGVNAAVKDKEILQRANTKVTEQTLECCVEFGTNASNTRGNALETRRWMEEGDRTIRQIMLVTSEYHIPRALMEFNAVLNDVRVIPYAVKSTLGNDDIPQYLKVTFIEYNKTLISWIKINTL